MATAAMLDFQNVEILGTRRAKRVKMRHRTNFAAIGQTVAEIWRFLFFNMAGAAMLAFQNVPI